MSDGDNVEKRFLAGSAARDFTPLTPQHLWGYPHVPRMSEGAHDPLLSCALYLETDQSRVLFIANDILFVTTPIARRIRRGIAAATGLPEAHILVSATHTHSAPKVGDNLFPDPAGVMPPPDAAFVHRLVASATEAGLAAVQSAVPARIGYARADADGIGTNRHDPSGPADHEVPVLAVQAREDGRWLGVMLVCSMHPTVMHEDSRLVSADFPWAARHVLQDERVGADCVVLHHMGCAGNQSPRYATRANTFEEAARIGGILGTALVQACDVLVMEDHPELAVATRWVQPLCADVPSVDEAARQLETKRRRFEELKRSGPASAARTAECDVFGAEQRLDVARRVAAGDVDAAGSEAVELQVIRVGKWCYAAWASETYVEFGLELKRRCADTFAITVANGQAPGYVTTQAAAEAGCYEAGAAVFQPEMGTLYVETATAMVQDLRA
jgi:neutral ceramidase